MEIVWIEKPVQEKLLQGFFSLKGRKDGKAGLDILNIGT